ncbi:MAG: carbamate kinase, partial [Streptosporangiaceae bacterium]
GMPRIVVAMGGNALARSDERGTYAEQKAHAGQLASVVRALLHGGYQVVVTHGNGPQVGNLAVQQEEGSRQVPPQPLSVLSAMTQGQIGHLLVAALTDTGADPAAVSVITHTVVDADDPAFGHPAKPVGSFLSEQQARALSVQYGWTVARDSGRGWRRVVPSPEPRQIIEAPAIRLLAEAGFVVVACGGGGIPVTREAHGLQGSEAVIDKDLSAALLASEVGASALMMLTDVDRVMLDFGTPAERAVDVLTVDEAEHHLAEGQFPPGSMGPKITAAVRFLRAGGQVATVTSPEQAIGARGGTKIVPSDGDGTGKAA